MSKQTKPRQPAAREVKASGGSRLPKWLPVGLLVFTALIYSRALQNQITFDDDVEYIINNPYLRDFSLHGILKIFTSFYSYNYHPLTTILWTIVYKLFALDPLPYHFLNVALHVANTFLVYKLAEKLSGKQITALVVAALFALHPMHVESVAWIAEMKGVLCAMFYISAALCYIDYLDRAGRKYYFYSLLLLLASLLSKPAAVTLPVLLVIIDWYKGRKINLKTMAEKAPFLALSVIFGIVAIMSQKAGGAMNDITVSYGTVNKIFLFTSGIASYLLRLVAPIGLCGLHYFPNMQNGALPWQYYCSLPFLLVIALLVFRTLKKTTVPLRKDIIFGILFFFITISVMLQIITVGASLTAERYTYVSYIGFFYIAGQWLSSIRTEKNRNNLTAALAVVIAIFSLQSYNRIADWHDTDSLFSDMIEKNKGNMHNYLVYSYWGDYKQYTKDLPAAAQCYSQATAINPGFAPAWFKMGNTAEKTGNLKSAIADYTKAISLESGRPNYFNYRGWAFFESGDRKSAMEDFNKALALDARYPEAYNNRGWIYYQSGDTTRALKDFDTAISIQPGFSLPYFNRAAISANAGQFMRAIVDYTEVLKYHPTDSLAYFNRGLTRINMRDKNGACDDLRKALESGYSAASQALDQYCR